MTDETIRDDQKADESSPQSAARRRDRFIDYLLDRDDRPSLAMLELMRPLPWRLRLRWAVLHLVKP